MESEANLTSFVLRFVFDQPPEEGASNRQVWHGVIRHVQTNQELLFSDWADAVAFVARYVDVQARAPNGQAPAEGL